jgi:hydroxylamine reductase
VGCDLVAICGKPPEVSDLFDLLLWQLKGIRLGPSLPAFISPNVLDVLVQTFDLKPIGTSARGDLEEILQA